MGKAKPQDDEIRTWAFRKDHEIREASSGIHSEMAVYIIADRSLNGEYGTPPDFKKMESEINGVTKSIETARGEEREKLYSVAWIRMTAMLRQRWVS